MTPDHFFVYGTLMRGQVSNDALSESAEFVATATVKGDLYSVSDMFPAMMSGSGSIKGELWRALPGALEDLTRRLDAIEGYREDIPPGSMYLRERVVTSDYRVEVCECGHRLAVHPPNPECLFAWPCRACQCNEYRQVAHITAWTYYWNCDLRRLRKIEGGDWRAHHRSVRRKR